MIRLLECEFTGDIAVRQGIGDNLLLRRSQDRASREFTTLSVGYLAPGALRTQCTC
jgi:hypothetical protein